MVPQAPVVFDRTLARARLARALREGYGSFLLERAAAELDERLSAVTRDFATALDVGTPTGTAARELLASGRSRSVLRLAPTAPSDTVPKDVCPHSPHAGVLAGGEPRSTYTRRSSFEAPLRGAPQDEEGRSIRLRGEAESGTNLWVAVADEEMLPARPASFDLAVSLLALQSVNDLPGVLVQVRQALRPDGLFLGCLLGGDTLTELRRAFTAADSELTGGASPRVAPFADVRALGGLLQRAGFALPVVDTDRVTVRYDSAFPLLADLRSMGATSTLSLRSRRPLRRAVLMRMAAIYAERFADHDGRLRATFDMLWLSGWAPHDSQQRPLRPGSAQRRLADALGTTELRGWTGGGRDDG